MFGKTTKEGYVQTYHNPLAISGCNDSPYMQEMLKHEEERRFKQSVEAYDRQRGFIR